jgi:hypothetical protein
VEPNEHADDRPDAPQAAEEVVDLTTGAEPGPWGAAPSAPEHAAAEPAAATEQVPPEQVPSDPPASDAEPTEIAAVADGVPEAGDVPAVGGAPDAAESGEVDPIAAAEDELAVLDRIEQDLAAVEEAMAGLDRIDAEEVGGVAAAAQVRSIVDSERFDVVR